MATHIGDNGVNSSVVETALVSWSGAGNAGAIRRWEMHGNSTTDRLFF